MDFLKRSRLTVSKWQSGDYHFTKEIASRQFNKKVWLKYNDLYPSLAQEEGRSFAHVCKKPESNLDFVWQGCVTGNTIVTTRDYLNI